jgi:hypothetical protein
MNCRTLPSQHPVAGRALIQQTATVSRTSCDEPQIPHGPPDGALAQAARAYPWALVVQIIGANPFAAEETLVESSSSIDVPVAHRPPPPGSACKLERGYSNPPTPPGIGTHHASNFFVPQVNVPGSMGCVASMVF